ncbi:nitroreductase family protein [Pontibacillus salipaludis]|uniref:nitroreductase family protein n=1 Tax=Pontibacillus salipaludis TaxID=1697394 RepID=UPI0031E6F58A
MRSILKKIVPNFILIKIKRWFQLFKLNKNYFEDMKRFSKFSFELGGNKTQRHMESDLIFFYHKIEKGLSLPSPRVGFGKTNVKHLLNLLKVYSEEYGWDMTAQVSLNTLWAYYEFNKEHGLILDDLLADMELLGKSRNSSIGNKTTSTGGVTSISKAEIERANVNFKDFAYSRYSLRSFSPGEIDNSLIKDSVAIAQKTPSVCNRQSWKVYVYEGDKKKRVLSHQNGNAGFGDSADKVLLVTADLQDFRGPKERNQAYIDGGLFSMSLIYALHSHNIGTCALNLSLDHKDERKLKADVQIPESEVTLMMIALGNFPDNFYVADSKRRDISTVLTTY